MEKDSFKYGTIKYINNVKVELNFCLMGFELKLIPIDWQQTMRIILNNKFVNEKFIWLKGNLISTEAINIQVYAQQFVNFILPNSSKFINVYASIYAISERTCDISTSFKYIEFSGGILDFVYPVSQIQRYDYKKLTVKIKNKRIKRFELKDNPNVEAIEYLIQPSIKMKTGEIVDFSESHSIVILELKNNIFIQDFLDYYINLTSMISFLCRQSNIRFANIRAYNKQMVKDGYIDIYVHDNYENYIDEVAQVNKIINFNVLGKSIINLYKTMENKKNKPNLLFLPENNRESNNIYYYSPIIITSSMEREYKLIANIFKEDKNLLKQSKTIKGKLNSIIKLEKCDKRIKNKCMNLFNALEDIEPNSKEKFGRLLIILIKDLRRLKSNTNKLYYAKFWLKLDEERDNLTKIYGKFYRIRGSAAHDIIEWKDGISNIYGFIEMIIYYFILRRIGVKVVTRFIIIENLFGPIINETYIQKEIKRVEYEHEGKKVLFEF